MKIELSKETFKGAKVNKRFLIHAYQEYDNNKYYWEIIDLVLEISLVNSKSLLNINNWRSEISRITLSKKELRRIANEITTSKLIESKNKYYEATEFKKVELDIMKCEILRCIKKVKNKKWMLKQ